jgi:predicted nuclease of restriction endonuclease-like RecB superfamily
MLSGILFAILFVALISAYRWKLPNAEISDIHREQRESSEDSRSDVSPEKSARHFTSNLTNES